MGGKTAEQSEFRPHLSAVSFLSEWAEALGNPEMVVKVERANDLAVVDSTSDYPWYGFV